MTSGQWAEADAPTLRSALEHFREGRLSDTERICRQILLIDPNEPDALYLLGLIAQQAGKNDTAGELIGQASRLQPSNPFFLNSLGEIHRAANDLTGAERCFRQALALDPGLAEVHNNLGKVLTSLGKLEQAGQSYRQALAVDPGYAVAQGNLGTTLLELKRFAEAEQSFRAVLALDPGSADAHNGLGVALNELGRSEEAEQSYRTALAIEPDFAEAHNNLGNTLRDLERPQEAAESFRRALALKPDYAEAHSNLGLVLRTLDQIEEARQHFLKALALKPGFAAAHNGMGLVLQDQRRFEEAEHSYREALKLQPDLADAHLNLGSTLKALGRFDEAELSLRRTLILDPDNACACNDLGLLLLDLGKIEEAEQKIRQSLKLKPGNPDVSFNYATLLLLRGDYESGFRHYEFRLEGAARRNVSSAVATRQSQLKGLPRWQGEDLRGKRLLLWTEQGLGDSLMMMRYLPQLKDRGADRLTVCCEPSLVRVMRTFPAADQVVSSAEPLQVNGFDCHCPSMSLPLLFRTRLDSIPAQVPYLRVPPELRRQWARRLAGAAVPRVGLVWAGGKLLQADAKRSIALPRLFPLLDVAGPVFVSLQKGEEAEQLRNSGREMLGWMDDCEDFLDTAALIEQLDLVISVDTAVAHLAGALGKPVWLLNRFESEWRWMLNREDSPWYPTMKIFRQSRIDDWDEVIARVASALRLFRRR
jgi:Flp pilus assembly protein TadD